MSRAPRNRPVVGSCAAFVIVAAMVVAGCGEEQSDVDRVRDATRVFVEGFRDQDGEAVCDIVTEQSRREFVKDAPGNYSSCSKALAAVFSRAPVQDFAKQSRFGDPDISNGRSSVVVTSPALQAGQRAKIGLEKVDDQWRVDVTESGIRPPD